MLEHPALPDLIAYAIPFFVLALVVESLVDRRTKAGTYRFGAAVADLNAGVLSRVGDAIFKGIGVALYVWVYRKARLFTLGPAQPIAWAAGLVGVDFVYYWWHRASHRMNLLWAVHAVHHQSESFNLAVAVRQPAFEWITVVPFHLTLALLGVDPRVYIVSYAINLIYQFWIHTELIPKLGPVEGIFNTPSAHRVHHGIEPEYLDRNYGGILVIWDRLFGTYISEGRPPTYGTTKPLASFDPVFANVAEFARIARLSRGAKRWPERLRAWIAHPSWLPPGSTTEAAEHGPHVRYEPSIPAPVRRYVAAHFLLLLIAGGAFAAVAKQLDAVSLLASSGLIAASGVVLAALCEAKRWTMAADVARQAAMVALVGLAVGPRYGAVAALLAAGGAMVALVALFAIFRPFALSAERSAIHP